MKLKPFFWMMLLASSISFTACNNDEDDDNGPGPDTAKPSITISQPSTMEFDAATGSTITLAGSVSDDRELSQIRIEIHNAFDGHTHGKTATVTPWAMDSILNTGAVTNFNFNLSVVVPAEAATGPYHVIFYALDKAGNEAPFVELDLTVTGGSAPVISNFQVNGNTPGSEVHVDVPADSIPQTITALITDNNALEEVEVMLMKEDHDHSHGRVAHGEGEEIYHAHFENLAGTNSFNLSATFPMRRADLENDAHYALIIKVKDVDGNYTFLEQEVHTVFLP